LYLTIGRNEAMRKSIPLILGQLVALAPAARAEAHEAWRAYRAGA
jgi:hypothetical protein